MANPVVILSGAGAPLARRHLVACLATRRCLAANPVAILSGAGAPLARRHLVACLATRIRFDVRWCLSLPDHVNIDEMLVKCLDQASVHKLHRRA